jgi:phosphoglucosamine mutase
VLALLAIDLARRGALPGGALVVTVMSNIGLEVALAEHSIQAVRVQVGDRYVVEEMVRAGYALGGEQSGHIVFLEHGTTGDGLVTALAVLARMVESGKRLSELRVMRRFPQVLVNVPVRERRDLDGVAPVQDAIDGVRARLGARGRVLVRYSGTEPLVRVMVEGEQRTQVEAFVEEIADAVRRHLAS